MILLLIDWVFRFIWEELTALNMESSCLPACQHVSSLFNSQGISVKFYYLICRNMVHWSVNYYFLFYIFSNTIYTVLITFNYCWFTEVKWFLYIDFIYRKLDKLRKFNKMKPSASYDNFISSFFYPLLFCFLTSCPVYGQKVGKSKALFCFWYCYKFFMYWHYL